MTKNEKIISWDPRAEHIYLIQKINEISGYQYTGQEAPLQQALSYILSVDESKARNILKKAAMTKIEVDNEVANVPKSIKVRVDKDVCDEVDQLFRKISQPPLKRIQRPYFVQVVLSAFYLHLIEESKNLGVRELNEVEEECFSNLSRFNLAVKISEMLFKNLPEDEMFIKELYKTMERRNKVNEADN